MEKSNTGKIHVGIVGAGISGLRCADILLAHGFQVTILEARDRIGGRICQSEELGYTVDIGPNWIHTWDSGEVHPIYHLAQQTGTPLHHWNSKQLLFDSEGRRLPEELTDRLSTLLWEVIEEAFEYSAKAAGRDGGGDGATEGREDGKPPKRWPSTIPADQSLYDFVKKRAAELLPDEGERRLLVQMSEMWGAYVGEPVWTQSLRFAWMEECCGGEEMFVESNYSAILQRIAAPALAGATIKLNTMVTGITTSTRASQENSGAAREQRAVFVSTADGTSTVFDELVVTVPLGWLKRNHERVFSPPLPPRLSSAIANLGLSILEKVFITFPSAFWVSAAAAAASAAAGQGQDDDDPFPSYTNWLSPAYADDTNPHRWPQEIWNLAAFAAPNRHPTMLFYLYGDCSRHVAGIVADTTPAAACPRRRHELLDAFFRPYYSRLPGFDPSSADCAPSAILATAWQRDELSGGASYCNFPAGIEAADEDVLAIREGCGEGRALWFCGEHAAPFEECGTVAGAYLSGEGVGRRIVGVRGLEKMEGGEEEEEEEGRAGVVA